jgi:hypothetical protein
MSEWQFKSEAFLAAFMPQVQALQGDQNTVEVTASFPFCQHSRAGILLMCLRNSTIMEVLEEAKKQSGHP